MIKPTFTIRYKFLIATTLLLFFCVGAYLWLATKEFKSDKKTLVYDFNLSLVSNTSAEVETFFAGVGDKLRMTAFLSREKGADRNAMIADLFRDRRDLVFVAKSARFQSLDEVAFEDSDYEKVYGVDTAFFTKKLIDSRPIPFQEIQTRGEAIWNATTVGGPLLIGYGKSVIEEDSHGVALAQFAMIGFVRADRVVAALKDGQPNEVFIVSASGDLLVHADAKVMAQNKKYLSRLSEIAIASKAKKTVVEFTQVGEPYLAAFSSALKGQIFVLSQISERTAFQAANRLVMRSLIFASMVVTLAFLVAIFFSRSLTRPLENLVGAMKKVSDGDLTGKIEVRSHDEIAQLTRSFNVMIDDLRISRQELEEINRELENKVKARTHELQLQNRAVKEAQEALLRTTRLAAVGEVAGQAAHEVLNPLTSIISRLNNLKSRIAVDRTNEVQLILALKSNWQKDFAEGGFQKLQSEWQKPSLIKGGQTLWQEDLENLQQVGERISSEFSLLAKDTDFLISESERIGRIVNSFRSLNAARADLKLIELNVLCDNSIKIMADLAARDSIQLLTNFSSEKLIVSVDDDEFIQVMTNLIRNAIQSVKARPASAGQERWVRIETRGEESQVFVNVTDNGVGLDEVNKKRLFEKNFSTKTKTEGTGIGLSISRRLVRAVSGDLTLRRSEVGHGADFQITLPRKAVENKEESDRSRGVA